MTFNIYVLLQQKIRSLQIFHLILWFLCYQIFSILGKKNQTPALIRFTDIFYSLDFRLLINILFLIIWNQLFVLITVQFCDSRSLFVVVHVLREHYENERVFQFVQHELLKDSSIIQSMFRYHTHTHAKSLLSRIYSRGKMHYHLKGKIHTQCWRRKNFVHKGETNYAFGIIILERRAVFFLIHS